MYKPEVIAKVNGLIDQGNAGEKTGCWEQILDYCTGQQIVNATRYPPRPNWRLATCDAGSQQGERAHSQRGVGPQASMCHLIISKFFVIFFVVDGAEKSSSSISSTRSSSSSISTVVVILVVELQSASARLSFSMVRLPLRIADQQM